MSETERVVAIIKDVECSSLGNWDGCCCSEFSIRNVLVEVSCGKGRKQGIWVSSRSMDYDDAGLLQPVMDEVFAQVTEQSGRGGPFAQHLYKWTNE